MRFGFVAVAIVVTALLLFAFGSAFLINAFE